MTLIYLFNDVQKRLKALFAENKIFEYPRFTELT